MIPAGQVYTVFYIVFKRGLSASGSRKTVGKGQSAKEVRLQTQERKELESGVRVCLLPQIRVPTQGHQLWRDGATPEDSGPT
jgi:hypothetical protein